MKDVEKLKLSHTVGGKLKRCNLSKQFGTSSEGKLSP